VIIASLAISRLILRPAGTGPANSSGVFAKVPRYFVVIPEVARLRAVVGVTATGAVRGTVAGRCGATRRTSWVSRVSRD